MVNLLCDDDPTSYNVAYIVNDALSLSMWLCVIYSPYGSFSIPCFSSCLMTAPLSTCIGCVRWVDLSAVHSSWPGSTQCTRCCWQRAEDCWLRSHQKHPKQRLLQEDHWRQLSAILVSPFWVRSNKVGQTKSLYCSLSMLILKFGCEVEQRAFDPFCAKIESLSKQL